MKAISVISDSKDYGYFYGNNYSDPFEDCHPDPVDFGEESNEVVKQLNQIFPQKGFKNVSAKIETFELENDDEEN